MSLSSLSQILMFGLSLCLTALTFFSNPRARLHQLLSLYLLACSAQWIVLIGYSFARSYEEACVWWQLDNIWPLMMGLFIPFVLAFTGRAGTRSGRLLISLHILFAFFLIAVEASTDLMTGPPMKNGTGWTYSYEIASSRTSVAQVFGFLPFIWYCYNAFIVNYLLFRHYYATSIPREKTQTLLLLIGTCICVISLFLLPTLYILGLVAEDMLSNDFSNIGGWLGNLQIVYGFLRYGRNRLTAPCSVASPAFLAINHEGDISFCNKTASDLLDYSSKALGGTALNSVLIDANEMTDIDDHEDLTEIPPGKARIRSKSGRESPVIVTGLRLSDKTQCGKLLIISNEVPE